MNGFFVLAAGFTGMDMDVKQGWQQNAPLAVDDLRVIIADDAGRDSDDAVTFHQHIGSDEGGGVFCGDLAVAVEAFHASSQR